LNQSENQVVNFCKAVN